ncbi:MAG: DUF2160 domain-containing protein [Congregibacter sp.]
MAWMAWTLPTAMFFAAIGISLVVLTLAELKWPTIERQGWLPMATTRGDRFFISLLAAAYIHLAWLAAFDDKLAYASAIAVVFAILVMRRG